ncbi:MAG: RNA methyltransferase [Chitinophagaceae bacterium]|nr:RNA methyltransferase [Oligoflexus sp.]
MKKPVDMFMGESDGIPDAWELLSERLSEDRRSRMMQIVMDRTAYLRLCLQDVHDPHNVGACFRTAEANGIQYCDFVNLYQKFPKTSSTVARGANHWLDISRFKDQKLYLEGLKSRGYKIAAAYPSGSAYELDNLPIDRPLVVLLGNEAVGLDDSWSEHIDYRFSIPMYGMTESYNVSVSAALILYSLTQRCRAQVPSDKFFLTEKSQHYLLNRWMARHSRSLANELDNMRRSRS